MAFLLYKRKIKKDSGIFLPGHALLMEEKLHPLPAAIGSPFPREPPGPDWQWTWCFLKGNWSPIVALLKYCALKR